MKFESLREKYKNFIFNGYKTEIKENILKITYDFEIEGLSKFNPTWEIPLKNNMKNTINADDSTDDSANAKADNASEKVESITNIKNDVNMKEIEALAFNLGMAELVSYWKITCAPNVIIKKYYLDKFQIDWWKKLYFYGLGEFFYLNNIKTNIKDFMHIETGKEIVPKMDVKNTSFEGALVPVGGGKDSIVTLNVLKPDFEKNMCYVINPRGATSDTVKVAGYDENQYAHVKRTLDQNMLNLNKTGEYLNGHTPYSSIVAFSSLIVAFLNRKKYIVLSNEASANESTIYQEEVNHQYSKSYEFEEDFNEYVAKYIIDNIHYFSLLRPVSEYQIAKAFAKLHKFYGIFKSCNVGSKKNIWCGHCPKCLFVYTIMSPFIDPNELEKIFGKNLFNDESLKETLEKLTGIQINKPFECVGSRGEVNTALCETINNFENANMKLPKLLEYYKTSKLYDEYKNKENKYNLFYNSENNVPDHYKELLKKAKMV